MLTIIIMVAIFGLMYFLMIRPQRRKMMVQQDLLKNLQVGDDVLTSAGIYGRISSFDEGSLFLEVSDGNYLKLTRDSIAQKISYDAPGETADESSSESNGTGTPEITKEAESTSEKEKTEDGDGSESS